MASKSTSNTKQIGRFTIMLDNDPKLVDEEDEDGIFSLGDLHDDIDDDVEEEWWLEEAQKQREQRQEEQRRKQELKAEEDFKNVPWKHMIKYKWKKDSVNLLKQKMKEALPGHKALLRVYLKTPNPTNKQKAENLIGERLNLKKVALESGLQKAALKGSRKKKRGGRRKTKRRRRRKRKKTKRRKKNRRKRRTKRKKGGLGKLLNAGEKERLEVAMKDPTKAVYKLGYTGCDCGLCTLEMMFGKSDILDKVYDRQGGQCYISREMRPVNIPYKLRTPTDEKGKPLHYREREQSRIGKGHGLKKADIKFIVQMLLSGQPLEKAFIPRGPDNWNPTRPQISYPLRYYFHTNGPLGSGYYIKNENFYVEWDRIFPSDFDLFMGSQQQSSKVSEQTVEDKREESNCFDSIIKKLRENMEEGVAKLLLIDYIGRRGGHYTIGTLHEGKFVNIEPQASSQYTRSVVTEENLEEDWGDMCPEDNNNCKCDIEVLLVMYGGTLSEVNILNTSLSTASKSSADDGGEVKEAREEDEDEDENFHNLQLQYDDNTITIPIYYMKPVQVPIEVVD